MRRGFVWLALLLLPTLALAQAETGGKVTGKVRYNRLVVHEGGQLSGEINVDRTEESPRSSAPVPPPAAVPATAPSGTAKTSNGLRTR